MFVRLRDKNLSVYHAQIARKHGSLFVVIEHTEPDFPPINLYRAKSIATGAICTLDPVYTERVDG